MQLMWIILSHTMFMVGFKIMEYGWPKTHLLNHPLGTNQDITTGQRLWEVMVCTFKLIVEIII